MAKRQKFGDYLRKQRSAKGHRLGEFARDLGVSTTYLSDVELGKRSPFGDRILRRIAALLDEDVDKLRTLAAESRGAFELVPKTARHREVGAALMRTWERLDEAKLKELAELTERWKEELDGDDD